MRETCLRGRVWALTDADGRLYDDIDTDQIYHNRYLHVTDVDQMGQHALGNLAGWQDFPRRVEPTDIVVAGRNFGAGSSRQHAVDCLAALGVSAVVAESFGAIYERNAINSGFAVVELPGLTSLGDPPIRSGGWMEIDLPTGHITLDTGLVVQAKAFSRVQMDIYLAGDLFAYGRSLVDEVAAKSESEGIGGDS